MIKMTENKIDIKRKATHHHLSADCAIKRPLGLKLICKRLREKTTQFRAKTCLGQQKRYSIAEKPIL